MPGGRRTKRLSGSDCGAPRAPPAPPRRHATRERVPCPRPGGHVTCPGRSSQATLHVDPDQQGHDRHHPGHHRPRGREPDARRARLRHEDRRRRDAGARRPRRLRRAGLRLRARHHREAAGRRRRSSPCRRASRATPCSRRSRPASSSIVIVTERIPRGEVAQMVELAKLRGARIIGPNCLGVLSPDEAKMGGLGGPAVNVRRAFKKGPIGVMSRSGGMTTEIANTLTAAGPRPVDLRLDRRRRDHRLDLRRADAALRGRSGDQGDRHLLRARRPHGGRARRLGARAQVAPADRRVHGRPLHGRDAGHALRPRRHDRRGQGRHHRRQDRAHARRRHLGRRAHRGHPGAWSRSASPEGRSTERCRRHVHRRRGRARSRAKDAALAKKLTEVCPVNIFAPDADGTLRIVEENLDECTLCELCIQAAPAGPSASSSSTKSSANAARAEVETSPLA